MGDDGNGQIGSMFDSSGWDPIHPLSQNLYPIASESKGLSGASQFLHYSDTSGVEMLPKFPAFGGGSFSGIANSYCLPGCAENAKIGSVQSLEDPQISEERSRVASDHCKRKRVRFCFEFCSPICFAVIGSLVEINVQSLRA